LRKVVVNLESRTDRRSEMEKQLARIGWQAEFFKAIRPIDPKGFPSIGARGCFLSHLSILQQAARDRVEGLLIMEDDLNFAANFSELWPAAYEKLRTRSWSIFYPAHDFRSFGDGLVELPSRTSVLCTHFMVFNGDALPIIVGELEAILSRPPGDPLGGPMHVDGAYSTIRLTNPDMKTFGYTPALGYQRSSRTDIGENKLFDRIELLRPVVHGIRKLRERMRKL